MPPQDPYTDIETALKNLRGTRPTPTPTPTPTPSPVPSPTLAPAPITTPQTTKSSDYLVDPDNPKRINEYNVGPIVSEMSYDEAAAMLQPGQRLAAVYHPGEDRWIRTIVGEDAGELIPKYVRHGPLAPGQQYFPDMGPGQQLANNSAEHRTPAMVEFAQGVWGAWEDVGKRFKYGNDYYERNQPNSNWESVGRFLGSAAGFLPSNKPFTAEELRQESFLQQALMATGIPGTMSIPGATFGIKAALTGGLKSASNIPVPPSVAVTKLRNVLKSVKAQKPEQQRLIREGRSERSAAAARIIEQGQLKNDDAFQTYQISLGRLKGQLDHVVPNNNLTNLDPSDMAEIQEIVMRSSKPGRGSTAINLGDGVLIDQVDYMTNMEALTKLTLGEKLLQTHEIRRLERIFGTDFVNDAMQAGRSGAWSTFSDIWNLPKSLIASYDLSQPGRQGWKMATSPYWKQWLRAFGTQFKLADPVFGGLQYDIITKTITDHKYYKFGEKILPLMEMGGTKARTLSTTEEAYMSNLSRFFPGVDIAERAYTGSLNKLRWDSFYKTIDDWVGEGKDFSQTDLEQLADFILMSTGRGKISKYIGGESPYVMEVLNGVAFSPRYVAQFPHFYFGAPIKATRDLASQSRILRGADKFLTGSRILGNEARNGRVSKIWAKTMLGQLTKALGVLSTAKMAEHLYPEDMKFGINPIASDFGQVKIGAIRYDFFAGDTAYFKFFARLITEKRADPITGEEMIQRRGPLIWKFMRSKMSPSASGVNDFGITHDDFYGNEIRYDKESLMEQAKQRLLFMFAQDMADVINLERSKFNSPMFAIPSFFGVGVMAYETMEDIKDNLSLKVHGVLYDDLLEMENGITLQSEIDTHRAVVGWREKQQAKRPPRDPDEAWFEGMASYGSRVKELEDGSERSGPGLLAVIESGAQGSTLHGAIQKYLSEKASAFMGNIPEEVEIVKEERLKDLVDIWRNRYWGVPLHIDPGTGIPDHDLQDWQQEQIIIKAQNAGIETEGMTARDLLTSTKVPSTNPVIAEAITLWRDDHDWLRENYWDLGEQFIKDGGFWDYYLSYKYSDYPQAYRRFNPEFDMHLKALRVMKETWRKMDPEIDRKLLKYGHITSPLHPEVIMEHQSSIPYSDIIEAQPR